MDAMKNVYFLSDAHLGSRAIAHGRTQGAQAGELFGQYRIGQQPLLGGRHVRFLV